MNEREQNIRPVDRPPQISAISELVVRPDEPILIGDITSLLKPGITTGDLCLAVEILVGTTFRAGAQYIDGSMLAQATSKLLPLESNLSKGSATLLLFPGNGAKAMIRSNSSSPIELEAISWFCRNPTEIGGYTRVQSAFRYRSTDGWPALNSLSTLLGTSEKSKKVRARFVKRFVRYPYGFFKQLEYIQSLLISKENV